MENFIFNITKFFQILVFLIVLYYLIISLFGFYKKSSKNNYGKYKTFALVVAAHNESLVIDKIIESLLKLNYPKDKYDIFIIADNCRDTTAKIAREYGVNVYERFNQKNKGKGYALEWMFNKLFKLEKNYDAVAVFDADNVVNKNFLNEMNKKMQEGYKVVQGYLDSKNPHDSWISECYSIAFWSSNRLIQMARHNLNLSNQLGGTGFAVDTQILKKLGWGATCLTEDLEFTCKLVLNNEKVGWAHDAVIYDEKPITLKQSWKQRRRWMQGFADVNSRFFIKLIKKWIKDKDFAAFDCALYVAQPFVTLLFALSFLLALVQKSFANTGIFTIDLLFPVYIWGIFNAFQFLITPVAMLSDKKLSKQVFFFIAMYSLNHILAYFIFGTKANGLEMSLFHLMYFLLIAISIYIILDKKAFKFFIWYMLYGLYTLTWIPITIEGILYKNKKEWSHTEHTRQIGIGEV